MIFGLYWRIQLKRSDRWKGILLYPLTASFILCTAYFIIAIVQVQDSINVSYLPKCERRSADFLKFFPSLPCLNVLNFWMIRAGCLSQIMDYIQPSTSFHNWYWWGCVSFIYNFFSRLMFNYFLFLKLYRCWIMWHRLLIMVIPCLLSLTFLGTVLTKCYFRTNFIHS